MRVAFHPIAQLPRQSSADTVRGCNNGVSGVFNAAEKLRLREQEEREEEEALGTSDGENDVGETANDEEKVATAENASGGWAVVS